MFRIKGVLRTTSPLHITSPGAGRVDLNGVRQYSDQGFPCTMTTKMYLAQSSAQEIGDDGEVKKSRRTEMPVIPANSIRGRLRREAARELFDVLQARGEQLSLESYNAMLCGAVTGQPDGVPPTMTEVREANAHPFFGLLGGGPRLLRSSVRVDTAFPINARTESIIGNQFLDHAVDSAITQVAFIRRNDDVLEFRDMGTAEKIIRDYTEAVNDMQMRFGVGDDKERGVRAFTATEFVSPGVPFQLSFEVANDYAHLGLFLQALRRFIRAQSLGGMGRNGFGRFDVLDMVLTQGDEETGVPVFGENNRSKPIERQYQFDDNSIVRQAVDAWEAAKATITAAQIEKLMKPAAKPEKKEKKAKVAA